MNTARTNFVQTPRQSQALPALVNVFFPPLGQLIQGRIIAFILWFFALLISLSLMIVGIGFILLPLLWILCIIEAAKYNPNA